MFSQGCVAWFEASRRLLTRLRLPPVEPGSQGLTRWADGGCSPITTRGVRRGARVQVRLRRQQARGRDVAWAADALAPTRAPLGGAPKALPRGIGRRAMRRIGRPGRPEGFGVWRYDRPGRAILVSVPTTRRGSDSHRKTDPLALERTPAVSSTSRRVRCIPLYPCSGVYFCSITLYPAVSC